MGNVTKRTVTNDENGMRLDRWFLHYYPFLSKSLLNKLIRKGNIRVDSKRAKNNSCLQAGQEIRIPPLEVQKKEDIEKLFVLSKKDKMILRESVLYEDENLFVMNKEAGIPVQGGSKSNHRNLDKMVRALFNSDDLRLTHRLDKETSGVLVFAKNRKAAQNITNQFAQQETRKTYVALLQGIPKVKKSIIDKPLFKDKDKVYVDVINGQNAVTSYEVIQEFREKGLCFVRLEPRTGRTHQLRVHMASQGSPILGDKKYGDTISKAPFIFLHAQELSLILPDVQRRVTFFAPLPEHFLHKLSILGFDPVSAIGYDN